MAYGYEEIVSMTREELLDALTGARRGSEIMLFYAQLHHLDAQEQADRMLKLTRVIIVLTVTNVALVAFSILRTCA